MPKRNYQGKVNGINSCNAKRSFRCNKKNTNKNGQLKYGIKFKSRYGSAASLKERATIRIKTTAFNFRYQYKKNQTE
jgi:hypothetical protein